MSARVTSLVGPIALLLALTAQLTGLVHLGVVRHERCAEHGELVDVDGDVALRTGDIDALALRSPGDARTALDSGGDSADGDDDHCDVAFRVGLHRVCFGGVVRDVEAVDVAADVVSGVGDGCAPRARDVLAVAPKTSPPTA